jgi:hypothetical protein
MTDAPEPRPCKRFSKRFVLNARLLAPFARMRGLQNDTLVSHERI